jgi:hypothetical protein
VQTGLAVPLVWSAVQLIAVASSSFTVTVNEHVPVLPAASDTIHCTDVAPLLNTTPDSVLLPVPVVTPLRVQVVAVTPQLSELPVELNSVPAAV